MPLLTVFTPTFNRKDTLKRTYESLLRQTNTDFVWLIIDDGSTDDTESVVKLWQSETAAFEIRYVFKENGGLHTGYNKAIELSDTELMVCIDSDDYMPPDAVELICKTWLERGSEHVAGIIGLDCFVSGRVVGNELPEKDTLNLVDVCVGKIDVHGDKKQVVRTELFKQVAPMPSFPGEKNFNPYYLILKIALHYEFLVLNHNLCFVDYQDDGMTANQWKQYLNSPNSFFETRKLYLSLPNPTLPFRIKNTIHYIASAILARRKKWLKESPVKITTLCLLPFGIAFSILIRIKGKRS